VRPEDIIAASFINCISKVPFYVAQDVYDTERGHKRVIIAIRGTLSLEVSQGGSVVCEGMSLVLLQDALTDVSVSMLKIPGGLLGAQPSYVHKV
jgi:hypothetical protein